ncbi:proton-translocating transhydrogenase family protein, partial [Amycolatopsis lurida]|uniref:proton-translocating transhydrogenase family protein n=1 Tax=Amycolatopsis lurida TaxID=31959 RepID=UPI00364F1F51
PSSTAPRPPSPRRPRTRSCAIHGIVLLGGLIVLGLGVDGVLNKILLVIAIAFGTINVVGGFLVTDRMLSMFKAKKPEDGGDK